MHYSKIAEENVNRNVLTYIHTYIYIYIYIYILYIYIIYIYIIYIHMQSCKLRSSCFCEIAALCVSCITYDHLYIYKNCVCVAKYANDHKVIMMMAGRACCIRSIHICIYITLIVICCDLHILFVS